MPTENELKYLLDKSCEEEIRKISIGEFYIVQGYFAVNISRENEMYTRVRSKNDKYFFALKTKVNDRLIEVEKELDERDFKDLWLLVETSLKKIRYTIKNNKELWEIDFFKTESNQTYLAIAEVELPEGVLRPTSVPDFIKNNLIINTPLDSKVYSNYSLAKYATSLRK